MANQFKHGESEQSFSTLVCQGRKRLNLSQEKFADFLGIPVVSLRGWEQPAKNILPNQATQNYVRVALAYPEVIRKVLGKQLQHTG